MRAPGAESAAPRLMEDLPKDELNEKPLVLGLHMVAQNVEPGLLLDVLKTRMRTYLSQRVRTFITGEMEFPG